MPRQSIQEEEDARHPYFTIPAVHLIIRTSTSLHNVQALLVLFAIHHNIIICLNQNAHNVNTKITI